MAPPQEFYCDQEKAPIVRHVENGMSKGSISKYCTTLSSVAYMSGSGREAADLHGVPVHGEGGGRHCVPRPGPGGAAPGGHRAVLAHHQHTGLLSQHCR